MNKTATGAIFCGLVFLGGFMMIGCAEVVDTSTTSTTATSSTIATTTTTITTTSTTTTTLPLAATPTFTLVAGDYDTTEVTVAIQTATSGGDIYYTLDGTTPTLASTKYTAPFKLTSSKTVEAVTVAAGMSNSAVAFARYNLWWWSALGGGLGEVVKAVALGSVYAGLNSGVTVNGTLNTYVARWNGSAWSSIGNAGNGIDQVINTMATDNSGNLYVGFNSSVMVDGRTTYIAKWNGSVWSSIGNDLNGFNQIVNALATDSSGNLYAGLNSSANIGGTPSTMIAKRTGTTWSSIGNNTNGHNQIVKALATDQTGNLYAGLASGALIAGQTSTFIAKWTGTTWESVGNGSNGVNQIIDALTTDSAGNLYVGLDDSANIGGTPNTYVAKWNGSAWSSLGNQANGFNYAQYAVAVDGLGRLYSGGDGIGNGYLKRWNGTTWEAFGGGVSNNYVRSVKIDANDDVYIGGDFADGDIPGVTGEEHIVKWGKL